MIINFSQMYGSKLVFTEYKIRETDSKQWWIIDEYHYYGSRKAIPQTGFLDFLDIRLVTLTSNVVRMNISYELLTGLQLYETQVPSLVG